MIYYTYPHDRDELEYDMRGLLGSFFPGEEFKKLTQAEAALLSGSDMLLTMPAPEELPDKAERKNQAKRALYEQLSRLTGKGLPWGTLTGIRPTKLVTALLEEGVPLDSTPQREGIRDLLRRSYLISEEKLELAIEVAREEQKVLSGIHYQDGYSLYIGIPFCPTRCLYCSFTAYPVGLWKDRVQDYLNTLYHEMEESAGLFKGKVLDTVYIGGGTPTALEAPQLDELLTRVEEFFDLSQLREFTVEAGRPDSITREKLQVLKKHPVTRISVNPQTMSDETLKRIGRLHTVADLEEAYALAREEGMDNINMDIILGLPGEGPGEVRHTVERILELKPDSLTVHALAVKRASRLKMEAIGTVVPGPVQPEAEEMMALALQGARALGHRPYYLYRQKNMAGNLENVGFAAPGKAGIYNILIMEEKQSILALGAGTVSKAVYADGRIERCDNVKEIPDYIRRIDEMIERKKQLWH